jgi:HAD superfamily hydrolase (TIGR01459 family)
MPASASPEAIAAVAFLDGLAPIVSRYDGFLLDQWGVLHDGRNAYAGARECLAHLRAAGKAVAIVSNSGRRGSDNAALLARMGFPRALYDHVVSAGDDARDAILHDPDPFYRALGKRCLLLSRAGDEQLVDGLGLTPVRRVEDADFLFVLGIDSPRQSVAGWRGVLEAAAARGLPMVCGNPDIVRVDAGGNRYEAPGQLGHAYAAMGGSVRYHGKPQQRIYRTALRLLGLPEQAVLAVGDSLEHDVAGAAGSGIDAAFVAGGIHRNDVAWLSPTRLDAASGRRLFARVNIVPRYAVPSFAV